MLRNVMPGFTMRWMAVCALIAAIGLPTLAGVAKQANGSLAKPTAAARPKSNPTSARDKMTLQTVVDGTHRAATAIRSGKGTVTVHTFTRRGRTAKGPVFEAETVYRYVFSGDDYRLSRSSTLLRNEIPAKYAIHPVKPGYQGRTEILKEGKAITMFAPSWVQNGREHRSPRATVSGGNSIVSSQGSGFVINPPGRMHFGSPVYEIELRGNLFHGNGIADLTVLPRPNRLHKSRVLRLAGSEMIEGDKCYIVELMENRATPKIDDVLTRVWVDPSKGFATPRVRRYRERDARPKHFLMEETDTTLRRYGHGVWGPSKVVRISYGLENGRRPYVYRTETVTYANDFKINVPVSPEELTLNLPPGTRVYDEKTMSFYVVNGSGEWEFERRHKQPSSVPSATASTFAGIGASLDTDEKTGKVWITKVLENTPAKEKGLQAGDVIIRVDGRPITGMSVEEVVWRLRGKPGTEVRVTVHRPATRKTTDYQLTRATIRPPAPTSPPR